jgi:hypothetical protein
MLRVLVTANIVHNSPILVALIIKVIRSSETLVLTRTTWRNIAEDSILNKFHVCIFKSELKKAPGTIPLWLNGITNHLTLFNLSQVYHHTENPNSGL